MTAYWVTFENSSPGCIEMGPEEYDKISPIATRAGNISPVVALAEFIRGDAVLSWDNLPYPARPRLYQITLSKFGPCPSFCYSPEKCKGRSACPKSYACSE